MNYREKIEDLIKEHHGTILSSDLDKYQIPRTFLQTMVAEGKLEKVNRGIYVSIDSIEDEMYAMQTKYTKLIYSHETAIFIHGLSDRTPFEYSVSVPSGYKVVENIREIFKIYYIKKEYHQSDIVILKSSFGNFVKVYSLERTICDLLRSRNRIDIQILNNALKRFVKMKSVDYSLLLDCAKKLKIDTILKNYLEILL